MAKNPNGNNTDNITVTVNLMSSVPAASKSFTLQAYNWSTNKWTTQTTNTTLAADTEGTLTGSITTNQSQYYSASFGVATFPSDATSAQQLIREADQRLYKAKSGGRNQVRGGSR